MTAQPLASLLVILAACSSPAICAGCGGDGGLEALPEAFRVDAEIVSVEGLAPDLCTPTMADIDPAGPDWQLEFARMHDPEEPTFKEWTTSRNGDSAAQCAFVGGTDCCEPLRADGGAWVLACLGNADPGFASRYEFRFAADGAGSSTSTLTDADDRVLCTARATWTAITP